MWVQPLPVHKPVLCMYVVLNISWGRTYGFFQFTYPSRKGILSFKKFIRLGSGFTKIKFSNDG